MKSVIINVDDLGLSYAVNDAVIHLAQMQRIQATSFMSLGKITSDTVRELQKFKIDIGLHFDLTGFSHQNKLKKIIMTSYLYKWSTEALKQQINRQLDAFEDAIGAQPIFIDGHQHIHQLPQIRTILISTIMERYGNKIAVRSTYPIQKDLKARIIYQLGGKEMDSILKKNHLVHNSAFAGVYNFNADINTLATKWSQWLTSCPPSGALIMCHPAMPATGWQDEIKTARELEWQWLSSDAFIQCWQKNRCQGMNWQQIS